MKFVSNAGQERVIDLLRPGLKPGHQLDIVCPAYSLFAFAEVLADATHLAHTRLITPPESADLALLGSTADRKVPLGDVDLIRCKQDLMEDRSIGNVRSL